MKKIYILSLLLFSLLLSAGEGKRENLALKGLISATSGLQADVVIDGNRKHLYWDGGVTAGKWTLEVDLGQVCLIDTVKLFFWWGDTRYYKYFMTVSADRKIFMEIADGRKNTTPPTANGLTFTFSPVKARYIRLHILSCRENGRYGHVREIEVYGKE
ncbi:MAG: discoidin domain-containing protein [Lentisphaeria bacterium]|nr:discoidin domain-containing protein [Lentisphaeria bacterium]